ncbi:MAG: hypothetical protein WAW41_11275 [Methylobacter sp.]
MGIAPAFSLMPSLPRLTVAANHELQIGSKFPKIFGSANIVVLPIKRDSEYPKPSGYEDHNKCANTYLATCTNIALTKITVFLCHSKSSTN